MEPQSKLAQGISPDYAHKTFQDMVLHRQYIELLPMVDAMGLDRQRVEDKLKHYDNPSSKLSVLLSLLVGEANIRKKENDNLKRKVRQLKRENESLRQLSLPFPTRV